jgi:hypothetical protein
MKINYNSKLSNKSIIIPPKTDPIYHNLHHQQNIAKWKDQRLELVEIPKGLIEVLQNAGQTVENILNNEPSNIAEKLGIDSYVGEIIFKETKKAVSKINLNLLIN